MNLYWFELQEQLDALPVQELPTLPQNEPEALDALRSLRGQELTYLFPGEMTFDSEGNPRGMNPPTKGRATLTRVNGEE
jgi:hypothetical protein